MSCHSSRDDGGWTLLELMMIVLVLSILVSIAIGSYALTTGRARRVVCQQNQRAVINAIEVYEGTEGHLPADLAAITPYVRGRSSTVCPEGPAYIYNPATGAVSCPIHPLQ